MIHIRLAAAQQYFKNCRIPPSHKDRLYAAYLGNELFLWQVKYR